MKSVLVEKFEKMLDDHIAHIDHFRIMEQFPDDTEQYRNALRNDRQNLRDERSAMILLFSQAIQAAKEEERTSHRVRVGMLRQWLNEDRITDTSKMVTNEDIEYWLSIINKHQ